MPADSPPAAGNPGGGGFAVAAIVASAITTALSETLEALEFMMQSDGSDTEQCSVNPQCMEPNTPQDCSPEQTSCSSGCTGADGAATAFAECVTAANGGTIGTKEEPSVPDLVDGNLHVEQVSVHPDAAGHGLGRSLIEWAAAEAAARGISALTLTTFRDVPWNAPYYARNCGFRIVDDAACGPGLQAIREHEVAHGLDRWPRVCMRRDLAPRG